MPSSTPTNTPKSVRFFTCPLMRLPTGWLMRTISHGIGLGLLEAERDAPVGGVDVEHHDVDLLADLEHLRRMRDALGPRHLGDVHQPLDAGLELDEGAVVGQADHLAVHARADRIALGDARPRIGHDLLHAERHAAALGIVLEHDDAGAVADADHVGRLVHAAPRHVGDVQQAVDAAEVDEGAVVGDVLHDAFEDDALFEHLQGLLLELRALALHDGAARDDDVAARAVELQHREVAALADEAIEVARRADVGVRAGQERRARRRRP